ncbi:MAG TPA: ester cyclase [Solirubrobacterales bacterium]|nr:ester cyclase [Solirubrobacterales bacterium]
MTDPDSGVTAASLDPEGRRRSAVARIMDDYADEAVVNDPLFAKPLVGKPAIGTHKLAEMIALSDISFDVGERWEDGNKLFANWTVTGVHSGPYYDLPATDNEIRLEGSTVVTRDDEGKITEETLFYDADDMRRQLEGRP